MCVCIFINYYCYMILHVQSLHIWKLMPALEFFLHISQLCIYLQQLQHYIQQYDLFHILK